ncbi:MAG: hypothetical protein ACI9UV_000218 [Algoriphagus sp.]|jgi:uncharacterized protein YkwD
MKARALVLICFIGSLLGFAQELKMSTEEEKLYQENMEYRRQNGLPPIALSKALTSVAKSHVEDLGVRESASDSNFNMHSWGEDPKWTSCCYTNAHAQANCMWNKPKEMTSYPGAGYEIAHGGSGSFVATAETAMSGWKRSAGHNSVILNKSGWENKAWKAIGIGIQGAYAVVWFGEERDST